MTIRVLVVEDSLTVRRHLVDLVRAQPDMEVVGEASDGRAAIERCDSLRPDVVTMDMMLPVLTGLAATEYIMAYFPTPILIVSASTNRGELFKTYDALAAGALDVVEKPQGGASNATWEREFVSSVRMASRIRVVTHPRARLARPVVAPSARPARRRVVGIGASTGGPAAVARILAALPPEFPLPILLVIHIGESFGHALGEWLDSLGPIPVRYARHREPLPEPGRAIVLLAPPDRHLRLVEERIYLDEGPEIHGSRPSVDALFGSLAASTGPATIAALLTGMGKDGAAGLLAIRGAGGLTLAQDEASSVVFGMPGRAVELGAATHVLGIDEIAPALVRAGVGREVAR